LKESFSIFIKLEEELNVIDNLVNKLHQFWEVTEVMSTEKHATISSMKPVLLKRYVLKERDDDGTTTKLMKKEIKADLAQ